MTPRRRDRGSLLAIVAVVLGLTCWTTGCGSGDGVPERLTREAEQISAVPPPTGWTSYVPPDLQDNQFVREIDGARVLFAGDIRDGGELRAFGTGAAWRSPVVVGPDAVAAACTETVGFADRAGFPAAVTAADLDECRALPEGGALRAGQVFSFADALVDTDDGSRTFGAGVLLADDGTVTVVVSSAFGLDP